MNPTVQELVAALTLEEKAGLCSGADFWHTKAVARLGIPAIKVSDGPHGLRTQREGSTDPNDSIEAVCFPAGCAAAASFDPALTRPGRFDRRVPVELPDLKGREEILKVHAKKIKTAPDVDFHTIARMAAGASGAELANIVNEAALRAVRDGLFIAWARASARPPFLAACISGSCRWP